MITNWLTSKSSSGRRVHLTNKLVELDWCAVTKAGARIGAKRNMFVTVF